MPAPSKIDIAGRSQPIRRLARIVNSFDGNISEAARAMGCSHWRLYWPLRRGGKISYALACRLSWYTGTPLEHWIDV